MTPEDTTTTIYRPGGAPGGFREVTDEACPVAVWAFAFAAAAELTADKSSGRPLTTPGCYVLADDDCVYIGESGNVARRLLEHACDPTKSFAREVFVVSAFDDRRFDKAGALYFQAVLRNAAAQAGLVHVAGAPPAAWAPRDSRRAPLDAMIRTARRLLFDAGCRAFDEVDPSHPNGRPSETGDRDPADEAAEDVGYFEIGVSTVPEGAEEYELQYTTVWARGHSIGDRFVIAAGSEIRAAINASANAIVRERHEALRRHGALRTIPGVHDRLRLTEPVAVGSRAIAAKVACGAHVPSSVWRPIKRGRPLGGVQ